MAGSGAFLGDRQAQGAIDNTGINPYGNGFWVVKFDPFKLAFAANVVECYHIALEGPAGSSLKVFVDQTFYETTPRGDINSYDPTHPLVLRGGQTLYFYWNSSDTPAPLVTTWWQQPLVS